jgi:amino acid adenylation domain-containing protein
MPMAIAEVKPPAGYVLCSREQEGLWLLEQTRSIGAANNLPFGVALEGELDTEALQGAFERLVESEPALRTEFSLAGGRLMRRDRGPGLSRSSIDFVEAKDQAEAMAIIADRSARPLAPLQWPPFRASLITTGQRTHVLLMVFHHCVLDGASMEPVVRAIATLYADVLSEGQQLPGGQRPGLALGRFTRQVAEEERLIGLLGDRANAHWKATLAAVEDSLRFPLSQRVATRGSASEVEFVVEGGLRRRLQRVGESRNASLFVTLLAALQAVQYRYSGSGDGGVATAVAMDARPRELRGQIGMFANEAPLLAFPEAGQAFSSLLDQVRGRARALFELRRFPFTEALARFGIGTDLREAGAQLGVTYLRVGHTPIALPALEVRPLGILPSRSSRRPLMLWLFDHPDCITGRLDYDPELIEPRVAAGFVRHYVRLLEAVAADPTIDYSALAPFTESERQQVRRWSGTEPPASCNVGIAEMVQKQVASSPESSAVELDDTSVSYEELNRRANRLAHTLRSLGAAPDVPVAVCLERSVELIVGVLGALKAGAAYVPLDPAQPEERLHLMLEQARPVALASTAALLDRLPGWRGPVVLMDCDGTSQPEFDPDPIAGLDDLAYIIFTSGSTGVPKGVAMTQHPLVNLLEWQRRRFRTWAPARTLQFASVGFDVAFQEIFSTLVTGGTLVMVGEDVRRDFRHLSKLVCARRIERLFLPFLALNELSRAFGGNDDLPEVMEVITAGERLEITPSIRHLFARKPGWTLVNQYGPTETHVVTEHRLGSDARTWPAHPPIGRPIAGARIAILDPRRSASPIGVPGELYVGGVSLARGYVNQATLTAERFVSGPAAGPTLRLYRTGDLVRWDVDGELEFLGRTDDQVKVRGYRVEPGEIEVRLVEHPAVREAAVVAREGGPGGPQLVAYVVPHGETVDPAALRAHVEAALPEYMVPAAFVGLDALPVTANGKLDRRRLPAPRPDARSARPYVAPRSQLERVLADIWADALGLERVGVEDDFFRLGGHSLLAAEVVGRSGELLDRDIPVRLLFAHPTITRLAGVLDVAGIDDDGDEVTIPRVEGRRLTDVFGSEEDAN